MKKKDYGINYDNYMNTNATTEVTGLIPTGDYGAEEWDLYRDIFDFEPIPEKKPAKDTSTGQ